MTAPAPEWRLYQPGQSVLCRGTLQKRDRRQGFRRDDDTRDRDERRRQPRPCHEVILRVGQGRAKRVRVVGRLGRPLPSGIRGDTHACKLCGTISELEEMLPLEETG